MIVPLLCATYVPLDQPPPDLLLHPISTTLNGALTPSLGPVLGEPTRHLALRSGEREFEQERRSG